MSDSEKEQIDFIEANFGTFLAVMAAAANNKICLISAIIEIRSKWLEST